MAALYSTLTEIAMIRISSASGTILLPGTSTITGRQVGFKDYLGTLTSNSTVTFSTQNGDYFEDTFDTTTAGAATANERYVITDTENTETAGDARKQPITLAIDWNNSARWA